MKIKILSLTLSIILAFGQIFLVFNSLPVYAAQNTTVQYAEIAHNAYNNKEFLKSAQYYEKAYAINKNKVFIDNAITSYLSYAFDLANEKKYDEAIIYCKKVLSVSQDNQNAKELLSDIYYTKSSDNFYKGYKEKAKQDLENALKYSVIPEQAQKAREGLSQLKISENQSNSVEFKPVNTSISNSIPELMKLMEMKLYGKTMDKLPLLERIQKIEKEIFNKTYNEDSLSARIDRLKTSIMPELSQKPVNNTFSPEDNYIQDIIEQSNGTARIFGKMPILVYIDDANVKTYKRYYQDTVKDAMKEWEVASENKIKFQIINDPMKANLKIVWTDYFEDFAWQPELKKEDIAAEKQKINYGKASSLIQIGSIAAMVLGGLVGVPMIGTLGSIGGSVASPLLQYKSLNLDDKSINVAINTGCTSSMTKEQAIDRIKQIALHQLGHSIGIYGHSPDSNDIMYSNFTADKLSERDKNTIKEIYKNVKTDSK